MTRPFGVTLSFAMPTVAAMQGPYSMSAACLKTRVFLGSGCANTVKMAHNAATLLVIGPPCELDTITLLPRFVIISPPMKKALALLLWAVAGCASVPETPDTHGEATEEERKLDAAKLLEEREKEGNLDRAVRVLEWQASQKPKDEKTRLLAAEAYSRSLEDMGEKKKTDTTKAKRLLTQGGLHAQAAIDIAPGNAAALYWRACLMLHQADVEGSLGKAKEAIALLEKADAADPK